MTEWEVLVQAVQRFGEAMNVADHTAAAAVLADYLERCEEVKERLAELEAARVAFEKAVLRKATAKPLERSSVPAQEDKAPDAGHDGADEIPAEDARDVEIARERLAEIDTRPESVVRGEALASKLAALGVNPDDKWQQVGVLCRSKEGRESVVVGVVRVVLEVPPDKPVIGWHAQVRQGDKILREQSSAMRRAAKEQCLVWLKDEATLAWARACRDGKTSAGYMEPEGRDDKDEPSTITADSKPSVEAREKSEVVPVEVRVRHKTPLDIVVVGSDGRWAALPPEASWSEPGTEVRPGSLVFFRGAEDKKPLYHKVPGGNPPKTSVLEVTAADETAGVIFGRPCPEWKAKLEANRGGKT